jgi:signal transduction protein with GAF and PtsI domain
MPEALLQLTREVIPWQDATLYLFKEGGKQLECAARIGREVNLIMPVSFDMGEGLAGWIARRRQPILLNDIQRRYQQGKDSWRSFVSIPLVIEKELVGVLNFGHREPEAFIRLDLDMLSVLGSQAALIIRNLELVKRLRRSHRELQNSYTRLRQMQEQLLEQEQLKTISRMVTTLNHEINNPLTAIAGNAEMLLHRLDDDDPARLKLDTILTETHKLGSILQQLANMPHPVIESYLDDEEMYKLLPVEETASMDVK